MNEAVELAKVQATTQSAQAPQVAEVHALSHEGRGIASVDGKTVFIEGALPNETVTFSVYKRHRRYNEAKVLEVLKPSKDRVEPACPHFSQCGGCSLQHMDAKAQIEFKQNVVLEQCRHFGGVEPLEILPPLLGPVFGYRRRARLGVKYVAKKNGVLVGFREKNGRFLADLNQCETLHPSVGRVIPDLKKLIMGMDAYLTIAQIEVAVGDSVTALVFRHLEPLCESDKKALFDFGQHFNIHIYLQAKGPDTILRLYPEELAAGGLTPEGRNGDQTPRLSYTLPEFNVQIPFQPADFTQVNADINVKMVKHAIELLQIEKTDSILDLFCGLGNFSLPMARTCEQVIGIEGSVEMVQRAKQNATVNAIKNAEFYAHDLLLPPEVSPQNLDWTKIPFTKVLLDPPRSGALAVVPWVAELNVSRIVYVSCNPATLARDVGEWVKHHGFRFEAVGVMDMFPQTTHVESIAVLSR